MASGRWPRSLTERRHSRSRTGRDITAQYPGVGLLTRRISREAGVIADGEIVVLDERGHSHFERLQERMHVRTPSSALVRTPSSDLLRVRSSLLRRLRLARGRAHRTQGTAAADPAAGEVPRGTRAIFGPPGGKRKRAVRTRPASRSSKASSASGRTATYSGTRSSNWVKIKATSMLDAVIGGWTAPRGGRVNILGRCF